MHLPYRQRSSTASLVPCSLLTTFLPSVAHETVGDRQYVNMVFAAAVPSPREFCNNMIPSKGPCSALLLSLALPSSLPLRSSLSSSSIRARLMGPFKICKGGRRRRRFTQLNHAIPIDNGAMMANSPSTAMHCAASADPILFSLSPFDSVTYFGLAATFAPRRVAPIGFRATKLDMVCVPILRPAGIALPALKLELDWWHTQLLHPVMADHPRNIVRRVRTSLAPPSPPTVAAA